MGLEEAAEYNKRASAAKNALGISVGNMLIIGRGRTSEEHSLVQLEDGKYIGFGFIEKDDANGSLEDVLGHIRPQKDNPDTRKIIRNYLVRNRRDKCVTYTKNPDRSRDYS